MLCRLPLVLTITGMFSLVSFRRDPHGQRFHRRAGVGASGQIKLTTPQPPTTGQPLSPRPGRPGIEARLITRDVHFPERPYTPPGGPCLRPRALVKQAASRSGPELGRGFRAYG